MVIEASGRRRLGDKAGARVKASARLAVRSYGVRLSTKASTRRLQGELGRRLRSRRRHSRGGACESKEERGNKRQPNPKLEREAHESEEREKEVQKGERGKARSARLT